ncbi:ribonuclease III domain-containing protein [Candidatus Nardonella dryophthoridicola]|uniref:Ribonuclease 3 n=1 Tax=endosymbiont of Metamasius hemipterus TaxID=204627 RepID=A0ABT0TX53_9GAMM|nr:ribonuclease III domain-containing protein [Candidatus Nardonella dryophthoridicola]MCM0158293.1 hypothetical protein [endosymbiont of Metamasius hemipterus]
MNIFNKIFLLEKKIEYNFKNKNLLLLSIIHKSFSHINNEKLEFLGDSILNFIITNILYNEYKNLNEGELTYIKSILVKSNTLLKIANNIKMHEYILIGKCEKKI